jgi:hypothetical protein
VADTNANKYAEALKNQANQLQAMQNQKKEVMAEKTPETNLDNTTSNIPATPTTTPESTTGTTTTTTPTTTTTQTTQTQGDQSEDTSVATPTTNVGADTTGVATTTPETNVSKEMSNELYDNANNLNDYATSQGYTIQNIDGKYYINNCLVDWQSLGLTESNGVLNGTKAQFDQLLKNVRDSGYTTGQTFAEFAKENGYNVTRSNDGSYIIVNGIPIDPSIYDSMTKLNNNWIGTAETYQKMLSDSLESNKVDPDYLASNQFADYARKKGFTITADPKKGYLSVVNGYVIHAEYYPGLEVTKDGKLKGDEATYRQILTDSMVYSRQGLTSYMKSQGYEVRHNENGYMEIRQNGSQTWRAIHAPYWQNIGLGELRYEKNVMGDWYASEEVYNAMIQEAMDRSDYSLEEYAAVLGYTTGRDSNGNLVINGKSIAGTNNTGMYDAAVATYYNNLILIDGKFVGSEDTYRQILTDLQNRSDQTFAQYGEANDSTVSVINNKVYINGNLVDTTGTSIQIINGKAYGTEEDFKALIDKTNEGYTYESPYDEEIQAALQEIQDFEVYQTPQETLDQINQLMESAKEQFEYDPTQDSALLTAQKEAERVVRESAATKGMLYSSGTISSAARKAGELIPTYEQKAYSRWADQKSRELNLLQTIMDWDEMQNDRNMDQLNLVKTKFDTIMDMDSKTLEEFKVLLDQKNADRQYALDQESLYVEQQQQELELTWKRVESLGYVDAAASVILGVPVGTKASWAQQAALEHQYALEELKKNNDYQIALQKSQAAIEKSLTNYKAALDEATQLRVLAKQYEHERSLEALKWDQQLYLARTYG